MKLYIRTVVRISLTVFLLGALSCSNNETPGDGTGVSQNDTGTSTAESTSGESVTIDMPRQPDSTGTPAIQVDPTDGNGSIHMGSGVSGSGSNSAHSNPKK